MGKKINYKYLSLLIVVLLTIWALVPSGIVLADDISGDGGDNVLNGTAGNDTMDGKGGNDVMNGKGGNDTMSGGKGNDTMSGGGGNDTMSGGGGNDTMSGGTGDDAMSGGAGMDSMYGEDGDDDMYGGGGNDRMAGGAGMDSMYGEDGNDVMFGDDGDDVMCGGVGDDYMGGEDGDDDMYGGGGNDRMAGGAGSDTMTGEDGNDIMTGEDGNDDMYGGAGSDNMYGGAGNDDISSQDGDDTITTSIGRDFIDAGSGNDTINITGMNGNGEGQPTYINAGTGINYYHFMPDAYGDLFLASANNDGTLLDTEDTLDFSLFNHSVSIDLGSTDRQEVSAWVDGAETKSLWITIKGFFTNLIGTNLDDTLKGNDIANSIEGRDGNDAISGAGGVDDIYGGDKTDALNSYDASDGVDEDLDAAAVPGGANHKDNWHSIEQPKPGSTTSPTTTTATTTAGTGIIPLGADEGLIPVTGGGLVALSNDVANTLLLPRGNSIIFNQVMDGYEASLVDETTGTLPGTLPAGSTFVSGMTLTLVKDDIALDKLESGTLTALFVIPAGMEAADFSILYWDAETGDWAEAPVISVADGFVTTTVDFPDTFVLVTK